MKRLILSLIVGCMFLTGLKLKLRAMEELGSPAHQEQLAEVNKKLYEAQISMKQSKDRHDFIARLSRPRWVDLLKRYVAKTRSTMKTSAALIKLRNVAKDDYNKYRAEYEKLKEQKEQLTFL